MMNKQIIKEKVSSFYNQLNVSERTRRNYESAIRSSFVKGVLQDFCGSDNLFVITDLEKLWQVYSHVNLHPVNIATHRAYSAAIMKYIRFLNNGKKYGKRIDYKRPRQKNNETSN